MKMKNQIYNFELQNFIFYIILIFSFPQSTFATIPVIDYASLIQIINEVNELRAQTVDIQLELKQLQSGQYQWSSAQTLINQLGGVMQETNGLAYNAANLDGKFKQAYPGYQSPLNYTQQYQDNVNMTLNTMNGVLQALGMTAADFQSENTRLRFLQEQSQSAQGQTQAIQASTQMSSEMISQLQLLRQTMVAQSNAQTAYEATKLQGEASQQSELHDVVTAGNVKVMPYGSSGDYLKIPSFY